LDSVFTRNMLVRPAVSTHLVSAQSVCKSITSGSYFRSSQQLWG
jgi:hypothetical protein